MIANLVAIALSGGGAQQPVPSAPITDIHYEIVADSATIGAKKLVVVTTFRVSSATPVVLALPAWAPGWYQLTWFARRVSRFDARMNDESLDWRKLDYQSWEIRPKRAGSVRVSFDYAADGTESSNAGTTNVFAFFTGSLFLYPVGRGFEWPARVTVRTEPSWHVASAMEPTGTSRAYVAQNYHDLLDMPFYVGRFDIDSGRVGNRWFRFALHPAGALTALRRDRAVGLLSALVREDSLIFGEVPFRNYTLFLLADSAGGGGLEHQNSQFDAVRPGGLDSKELLDIYSHELFHAWNVKRLRPAEMVPYRYDVPQPTPLLWISEGITEYYSVVTLCRSSVWDSTAALEYLARWIFMVDASPPTALSDVSLSTWIASNLGGPDGLYYPKGALTGFLLDVMIRDASSNRHSLDDVMRHLYASTFKRGTGFTTTDWWSAIASSAGGPQARERFREFARRYVDGREPLPVDSVFSLAGLSVERRTIPDPRSPNATRTLIRVVPLPSASAKAVAIREGILAR